MNRDKKLLHIPCCLGNRLINISLWWEAVKEQRKAAQSIFKFNKRIANVTIATTDLFWACPDLFLLKEHLKWIFLSDFYFYFKNANQQCRFIKSSSCLANLNFFYQSTWIFGKCMIAVSCNETYLGSQCKVVEGRGTAAGLKMLSVGAMKTDSFKMQAGLYCGSRKRSL